MFELLGDIAHPLNDMRTGITWKEKSHQRKKYNSFYYFCLRFPVSNQVFFSFISELEDTCESAMNAINKLKADLEGTQGLLAQKSAELAQEKLRTKAKEKRGFRSKVRAFRFLFHFLPELPDWWKGILWPGDWRKARNNQWGRFTGKQFCHDNKIYLLIYFK